MAIELEPQSTTNEPASSPAAAPPPRASDQGATWRQLLAYLSRQKFSWILAVGSLFLAITLSLLGLGLFTPLIDVALPLAQNAATRADGLRQITALLVEMIGIVLLSNTLFYMTYNLMAKLAQNMIVTLRTDYYASVMRQGPSFHQTQGASKLLSVGMNDAEVVGAFFTQDAPGLLNLVGQLALALIFMLVRSWPLTLVSVALAGFLYQLSTRVVVPRIRRHSARYAQQFAAANATLNESVTGVRDIQLFTQADRTAREFRAELERMAHIMLRNMNLLNLNGSLAYSVSMLGLALIYGLGTLGIISGSYQVGLLVSFAAYFSQFINPIRLMGNSLVKVQSMLVSAQRVFDLIALPPDIREKAGALDPGPLKGHIKFDNVTFSYVPEDIQAWRVKNVNLEILPGEKVAFVGGSGSGKSTLLYLVARFYDVTAGRVTVDGYDVRDLKLEALRRNFGLVAQNVILFHGTVADNIRFARPEAGMDAVKAAAEIGYITEFLDKLEYGYDTVLGELGQGLSGGQKQRVSIARAALPNPSILILDEATSALDPQSEAAVMKSLDRLSEGRTTLVITHRLNTIVNADKIVVLDTDENGHGVVRAVGQHDQLLETSPEYAALWGKHRRKAILMPIGPLYDTTAALPTVMGLARAYNAPAHILDFGPIDTEAEGDKRFGVTVVRGAHKDPRVINLLHMKRVHDILKTLRAEGIEADTVSPARKDVTWVEATIQAVEQTQATHLVAVDNVMVSLDQLRESIRQIERKSAVEYILVNPVTEVG